jgi:hypothetical protein
MRNIRTMPAKGWVPVSNDTAQCRTLSWRAKGLLLDLLSFPSNGYPITFDRLMSMAKAGGDKDVEGREAMRTAMQELERKGYIAYVHAKVENPKPGGQRWKTETVVCDEPGIVCKPETTAFWYPQDPETPESGAPADWDPFNNTGSNKTDAQQDELAKHGASLADTRSRQQAGADDHGRLDRLYSAAAALSDDQLRRLLVQIEDNRPGKYRDFRRAAMAQLRSDEPHVLKSPRAVPRMDLLSYQYALQHYAKSPRGLPLFLTRFPKQPTA